MIENNWRLCSKCAGLYSERAGLSVCPGGGAHDPSGTGTYVLSDTELNLPVEATLVGQDELVGLSIASATGGNVGISVTSLGPSAGGINPVALSAEVDGFGTAVWATAQQGPAMYSQSDFGEGVVGSSKTGRGVHGRSEAAGDGVAGFSQSGTGVFGEGPGNGVHGKSEAGRAVFGQNTAGGDGVGGFSDSGTGVAGVSNSGSGVYGRSNSGMAGFFEGNIQVTGAIHMEGADFAEQFSVPVGTAPGTVMVIDDTGNLSVSQFPYDRRVAGVIAGAGQYRPGLVLDTAGKPAGQSQRQPLSLLGKTYCMVDATTGPIGIGDLLTTAASHGCAMRAADPDRAFGAVLGKALAPVSSGQQLIPILIALQ